MLKPIKPEQASTVSVLILIFAESVDCKIPISGIFDDFCISIDANCIFDHLYIGTGDRHLGVLPCLRLSSLFVMMSHSSWGTTTRRMVSEKWEKWFQKSSKTVPVADQARFGEKEQIEAATASAKSARTLVVFQCALYIFI